MTSKKYPLTVIFGLIFTLAGGRAFADTALDQAKNGVPNFDGTATRSSDIITPTPPAAAGSATKTSTAAALAADTKTAPAAAPAAAAAKVPAPPPPPPAPAPNPIAKFAKTYSPHIVMGGLGAFLGSAFIGGPVGIAVGALLLIGLVVLSDL